MKSGEVTIEIPWRYVVSKNRKSTVWSNGRIALSTKYSNAKDSIHKIAKLQSHEQGVKVPCTDRVGLELQVYPPDKRHRDIFNVTQCIFDGIEGTFYEDDWQIDHGLVLRCPVDRERPRVVVKLWRIHESE